METKQFNELIEHIYINHVKKVFYKKSEEYSSGIDRLHNFKRAAEMSRLHPIDCLRGMKLKHDVSLADMLDDYLAEGKEFPQELWQEKLTDDINYLFLLWALLFEEFDWRLK